MNIYEKLRTDIWEAEKEANIKWGRIVTRVREIKIHPEKYMELVHECRCGEMQAHNSGDKTFIGIPIEQDDEVEGWEIVI